MSRIPVEKEPYPVDPGAEMIAFRLYFPTHTLPWADRIGPNGRNFHDWILALKRGDENAINFGCEVLKYLTPRTLLRPDLVVAAPTCKAFTERPDFPLLVLARHHANEHQVPWMPVVRTETILDAVNHPEMRDEMEQQRTMRLPEDRPPECRRILVLDDIKTSGATLGACRRLLRQAYESMPFVVET